ncbi:MAG: T9SS type A sorting domain-containing protein [Bacteroidaceae bacterium]|nr:T9SS type A sorting domain-containing protein [Bacteroidaceae bacterium]
MKKYLFSSILLLAVLSVQAQLVVDQNGDIAMKGPLWSGFSASLVTGEHKNMYIRNQGYTGNSWATALETDAAPISGKWGVGVQGTAYRSTENAGFGRNFGVIGRAGNATPGYNYGVFGQLLSTTYGAAIFGTTSETTFGDNLSKKYAGYFDGPVKVTGELEASGGLVATFLGMSSTHSGATLTSTQKTEEVTDLLQGLSANAFYQEKTIRQEVYSGDTIAKSPELSAMQQQIEKKIHYGLSADQMEAIFPELVYETEDGEKAINYMELVPVLVQAINELNFKISVLQGGAMMAKATTGIESVDENNLSVNIPSNVRKSSLYLYTLSGRKVLSREITVRGNQIIGIDETGLDNGIYLYSVIADGKILQTRKIIIGEHNIHP